MPISQAIATTPSNTAPKVKRTREASAGAARRTISTTSGTHASSGTTRCSTRLTILSAFLISYICLLWTVSLYSLVTRTDFHASHLIVKLDLGEMSMSSTLVGKLPIYLDRRSTSKNFRVLPLDIYNGILGMDWLLAHEPTINSKHQSLLFKDYLNNLVFAHIFAH